MISSSNLNISKKTFLIGSWQAFDGDKFVCLDKTREIIQLNIENSTSMICKLKKNFS